MTALTRVTHAWRLGDLLQGLVPEALAAGVAGDRQVSALGLNSRETAPGTLFMACPDEGGRELEYAEEAARRGATAILAEPTAQRHADDWESIQTRTGVPTVAVPALGTRVALVADRFYGAPSAAMEVFGVLGGAGKSSVAHLLAQALQSQARCALLGSIGIGYPGELRTPGVEPTANPVTLHATLADLRSRGAEAVAVAIRAEGVRTAPYRGLRLSHAVAMGKGQTDGEKVRGQLAQMHELRWAVLNFDDPYHRSVLEDLPPRVQVAGYSMCPNAEPPARCDIWVRAASFRALPAGLRLRVESNLGTGVLRAPLLGAFNGANLLSVLAVLLSRGASMEDALRDLQRVRGVPGRMEPFGGDGVPLAVVDNARSPDALEMALTSLRLHGCRRSIVVVGCGGDRDPGQRPLIGAVAERLSDALILTDDNPRTEDGNVILGQVLAGLSRPDRARIERRRGLAIRRAIAVAGQGDAVLVAGRGHETTQDMGDLKVHFSDRAQVFEALREWREGLR